MDFDQSKSEGVDKAWDFVDLPSPYVKKQIAIIGMRLQCDVYGAPTLDIEEIKPKKNIEATRSFAQNHGAYSNVKESIPM